MESWKIFDHVDLERAATVRVKEGALSVGREERVTLVRFPLIRGSGSVQLELRAGIAEVVRARRRVTAGFAQLEQVGPQVNGQRADLESNDETGQSRVP